MGNEEVFCRVYTKLTVINTRGIDNFKVTAVIARELAIIEFASEELEVSVL